jgi:hypothetical protein
MMADTYDDSGQAGRRTFARLQVGIGAWLETLDGKQSVRLVDLSQGGAHVILSRPDEAGAGVLTWLDFETFGELAWQDGNGIGLTFDKLLPLACLVETRQRAPSVVRAEELGTELAKAWVSGEIADH